MLDLELIPDESLGCDQWEFRLGMHFSQSVAIIQSQVGVIKGVQVLYNDANPLGVDLIINLPNDGIKLFFDPILQRLKVIEIYNMKLVKLRYGNALFNSPEVLPSFDQIEHTFGATHPVVYHGERHVFSLNFRGVLFYFPLDHPFQVGSTNKLGSIQVPVGSSPLAIRTAIYHGSNLENAIAPDLPLSCYQGQIYLKSAEILRGDSYTKGLKLVLFAGSNSSKIDCQQYQLESQVLLGDTAQDVALTLGAPSRVFYKSEDKMRIHSPNVHRRVSERRSDYFFNYFTLGFDILFDAHSHLAKKIVLHTNYPGHYNFNMYQRCEFKLPLNDIDITAYSRWDDLVQHFTASERPVVLNRTSSTNTTNPFGSTFCYGYQDIIFEVMPNNYIASISVYGDGRPYESDFQGKQA